MKWLVALGVLGISVAGAGCRKSMAPVCRQICACSPCSGADMDACLLTTETAQQDAEQADCTGEFETFMSCFEDTLTCETGQARSTRCTRVEEALRVCSGAGSPFATVCDKAAAKIAACDPTQEQQAQDCNTNLACLSECELNVDCEVLLGNRFDQAFVDCTTGCFDGTSPPQPGGGEK